MRDRIAHVFARHHQQRHAIKHRVEVAGQYVDLVMARAHRRARGRAVVAQPTEHTINRPDAPVETLCRLPPDRISGGGHDQQSGCEPSTDLPQVRVMASHRSAHQQPRTAAQQRDPEAQRRAVGKPGFARLGQCGAGCGPSRQVARQSMAARIFEAIIGLLTARWRERKPVSDALRHPRRAEAGLAVDQPGKIGVDRALHKIARGTSKLDVDRSEQYRRGQGRG